MDKIDSLQRSKNMAAIRSKDTRPELAVRQLLYRMGFRYRLHDKKLPGTPDIVLRKYGTCVFVHGCFWHHHKNCSRAFLPKSNRNYWLPKIVRNATRDKESNTRLRKMGWKVITVWECQTINRNKLAERLSVALKKIVPTFLV